MTLTRYAFGRGYLSEAEVSQDYKGLHLLLEETHLAFAPSGRVITMAYYPDGRQERLLPLALAPILTQTQALASLSP